MGILPNRRRPRNSIEGELCECPGCKGLYRAGRDLRYKGVWLSKEEALAVKLRGTPIDNNVHCTKCWRTRNRVSE